MQLTYRELDDSSRDQWQRSCLENEDAWFWHSSDWLTYSLVVGEPRHAQPLSFLVLQGRRPVAICPLHVEDATSANGELRREFSLGGGPCPAPSLANDLVRREQDYIIAAILDRVAELAAEHSVCRATFKWTPLAPDPSIGSLYPQRYLRHGYVDVSVPDFVVDLGVEEPDLWRAIRPDHRKDIRQGEAKLTVEILHQAEQTRLRFDAYAALHEKAAGRRTRPAATFDLMEAWIQRGNAVLFLATLDGEPVGAFYVLLFKRGAFSASSANDPAHRRLPIGHVLEWAAIRWLRDRGFRHFDLGMQTLAVQPHQIPTDKEMAISDFKQGFGGRTIRLPVVEGYFDAGFFRSELCRRTSLFMERTFRPAAAGSSAHPADPK